MGGLNLDERLHFREELWAKASNGVEVFDFGEGADFGAMIEHALRESGANAWQKLKLGFGGGVEVDDCCGGCGSFWRGG